MSDMFGTDDEALAKLTARVGEDTKLRKLWLRMNGHVSYKNDEDDYDYIVPLQVQNS